MQKLNQILLRLGAKLRSAMEGRYGVDQLNIVILVLGLFVSILGSLFRGSWAGFLFVLASYALMIWAITRVLSRNIYKRYEENRRYLQLKNRLKDRHNCYFYCPKCHQTVRVPRGKGKIAITCPRCREKFTKKT